jgi:hypothetical protein
VLSAKSPEKTRFLLSTQHFAITGTPWQYNLLKFEGVPKLALAAQAIFIFMGN